MDGGGAQQSALVAAASVWKFRPSAGPQVSPRVPDTTSARHHENRPSSLPSYIDTDFDLPSASLSSFSSVAR